MPSEAWLASCMCMDIEETSFRRGEGMTGVKGITMVIRSLMGGGAERVMSTMANYWAERGVAVSIITSEPRETDAYTVDPRIRRVWLRPSRWTLTSRLGFPWSIRALRRQIRAEGHRLVISFMDRTNIPVLLATRGMDVRLIVGERIDPRTQNHGPFKRFCMRLCYPWADAVTVQTETVKREWAERLVPAARVRVIHNPVLPLETDNPVPSWLPEKFLCCLGRLHRQKGLDILFRALPEVFERHPEQHLVILGEGPERENLERLAKELGIADRILMPGFIRNPHSILSRGTLFLLPSRFEGFPNALVEAMSIGLPVISADCPSGPSSLVEHGKNGILVPVEDTDALRTAILDLLSDTDRAARLGAEALRVREFCNIENVMRLWEGVVDEVMGMEARTRSGISARIAESGRTLFSSTARKADHHENAFALRS